MPNVSSSNILTRQNLKTTLTRLKRQGKTIAFTNGCFDLLHVGHLSYLEKVKALADILVVGVNSDASVRRLKGKDRPIVTAKERARLVGALKPVDYVSVFASDTPLNLILEVRPDILAKGADWKGKLVVGQKEVESWGGRVKLIKYIQGRSSTNLIHKAQKPRRA